MDSTSSNTRAAVLVAVVALVACISAGCRSTSATKAGKSTGSVVLRMADSSSDLEYEPAVAYFVDRVRLLSHGAMRVEVVHGWGGYKPDAEQQIIRDVANGNADLAWVGTRIFDTFGIQSFQALTAPMLIDNYPLERAVITSDIPNRMLVSLDKLGVKGLAVLADGLRKPIAARRPLLGPAGWHGIVFATFRSREQAEAIRALGARPVEVWSTALADGLVSGRIDAFEKNLLVFQVNQLQRQAPFVTANINLWPQTVALLANPARLSELRADQHRWLQQAARDAASRSTTLVDRDQRLVGTLCAAGTQFADASPMELAEVRQAFAPVYRALARDPQTKAFIARIEKRKDATPAGPALAIPAHCAARPKPTPPIALGSPGTELEFAL